MNEKGAVSVYGLQRMPVSLYLQQWERLLGYADEIWRFIKEHETELKRGGTETDVATAASRGCHRHGGGGSGVAASTGTERAGQDLEMLELTLEVEHRIVRRLLRVLPVRLRVAADGRLDQEQHSRLAMRRLDRLFQVDRPPSVAEWIGQLEADANYFWEPTKGELAVLADRLGRTPPEVERAVYRP